MKNDTLLQFAEAETRAFEWGRLEWFASGKMGNSAAMTVGRCTLHPGCENPRHVHPNCEEVMHLLSGSIEHYIEGLGWFPMNAGDTVTIAAGRPHHARNRGDENAVLFLAFSSPQREVVGEF